VISCPEKIYPPKVTSQRRVINVPAVKQLTGPQECGEDAAMFYIAKKHCHMSSPNSTKNPGEQTKDIWLKRRTFERSRKALSKN
jgi:hypothetical protein